MALWLLSTFAIKHYSMELLFIQFWLPQEALLGTKLLKDWEDSFIT